MKQKQANIAKHKLLWLFTKEQYDSLFGLLQHAKKKYTRDDFHDMRVNIKKLDAVTRLLKFADIKFRRKKWMRRYKQFFALAGEIRETQLEQSLFEEMGIEAELEGYIKTQKNAVDKIKKQFAEDAAQLFTFIKPDLGKLKPVIASVEDATVAAYIQECQKELFELFEKQFSGDDEVHELRKKLKSFMYIILLFEKDSYDITDMDKWQDLLGKWHDKIIMVEKFSNQEASKKINAFELQRLQNISDQLKVSIDEEYSQIMLKLEEHKKGKALLPLMMTIDRVVIL